MLSTLLCRVARSLQGSAAPVASNRLSAAAFSASSASDDHGPRRGRTVGELGNDAAQELSGAEGKAASSGARVEEKASSAGFVPADGAASPSPEAAGAAGGPGADLLGDLVDVMGAAWKGDDKRAAADIADATRAHKGGDGHVESHHTEPQQQQQQQEPGSSSEARDEGPTSPRIDPSEEMLSGVDPDPHGSVAAGPTRGARGGDTRPV